MIDCGIGVSGGFCPQEIRLPIWLWYGDSDNLVSRQMPEYLNRVFPASHLTISAGAGHMLFYTHWEDMLGKLVAQQRAKWSEDE